MHFFKILYVLLKMICFNDGMLKKWNLRLLKSSMRIYAYLCASMRVLGYPLPKWHSFKIGTLGDTYVVDFNMNSNYTWLNIDKKKIVILQNHFWNKFTLCSSVMPTQTFFPVFNSSTYLIIMIRKYLIKNITPEMISP